jgi:hypothetical protein
MENLETPWDIVNPDWRFVNIPPVRCQRTPTVLWYHCVYRLFSPGEAMPVILAHFNT